MVNGTDIYQDHKGYYIECKWWSRKKAVGGNNALVMNSEPSGYFMAKEYKPQTKDTEEYSNAMRLPYESTTIKTIDHVEGMQKDDLVLFNGNSWRVTSFNSNVIIKTTEFGGDEPSRETYIELLKGA